MTPGFSRLVDILLPSQGIVMVAYEGYFDESGDFDVGPKIFCVAGYFFTSDAAKTMDVDWRKVLSDHSLPYFHMVDCAHGVGVFKEKSKDERIEIAKKLIDLIKRGVLAGFSVLTKAEYFSASDDEPDEYSSCVSTCVTALRSFLEIHRLSGDIAYFFETGHENRGRAYKHIAQRLKSTSASISFAAKQKVCLLQAADILAWQSAKYVKDRFFGTQPARPPRKDFMSLLEIPHTLAYVTTTNGERSLVVEDWPLSVRSPITTMLTINNDGPMPYFFDGEEKIPITPIESTDGFRMGGRQMCYVKFTSLNGKEFALAFEERRLLEAIGALMHAMSIYTDSDGPIINSDSISIEETSHGKILRVVMGGAPVSFLLSEDSMRKLKSSLS